MACVQEAGGNKELEDKKLSLKTIRRDTLITRNYEFNVEGSMGQNEALNPGVTWLALLRMKCLVSVPKSRL